jgi:hypothetical protein
MPAISDEPINSCLGLVMKLGISGKNTLDYKSTLPTLRSGNSKVVIICNNNCPPPNTSCSSSTHLLSPALLSPHRLQTGLQGWTVTQKSFIAGTRSLNEEDLHDNLTYFKVPQAGIDSIRSKLAFKIFDEYANILKGMYSTRFNGRPKNKGDHDQMDTVPDGSSPPLITSLQAW